MASNYNIGPRIGIEGEREFRQQISRINAEYKGMDSYIKALDKSMELHGRTQETLASRSNALRQQIGLQQQKFEQLYDALGKARTKYGENSQEVMRFEGALLDVKSTTADLQRELDATENELKRMAEGLEDVGQAADTADGKVMSFGDMLKAGIASGVILGTLERVGDVIVEVGSQSIDAAADAKAANAQFSQAFGNLEGTATSALRSISNETGIAVTRLQGGYTALYAFTKSVGGDSDTALNIAQRALTAAADSAAYYDRTVEDATETLQSFLKGNYENDAALGIAATETTRNAKANELYAKSFNELSEAQKVDTLLAMVEAGNAASGALGSAARESGEWTNTLGEFNEQLRLTMAWLGSPVLGAITPLIQGTTQGLRELTQVSSYGKLRDEVAGFRAGLEAADQALADSNASMAATAGLAGQYVDRLEKIESAGLTTAEAQREYAQTVELLNALMPELGLTINEVTGHLDQNTTAIRSNIRSLKAQAEQQARNAYYQAIIDEYTKAYKAQYAAQARLIELEEQEQQLLRQGADATREYTEEMLSSTGGMAAMSSGLSALDQQLVDNRAEQTALKNEMETLNGTLSESEERLVEAENAVGKLADQSRDAAAAAGEQADAQAELAAAYEESQAKARESIDSQIGLFTELETKSEMSARQIVKNWEKQQAAFDRYGDNLKKAVEMGLDEALVQQLADGSQQSMLILNELVNSTKVSVGDMNAAFRGLSESKDYVAAAVAEINTTVESGLSETVLKSRTMGYDSGLGVAKGIRDAIPEVESAWVRLAKKGQGAYLHTYDQHSPSRVMRSKGRDTGLGAALGVEDAIPDMERAMERLAQAGASTYMQEQVAAAAAYPTMALGSPGIGGGGTTNNHNVSLGGVALNIYQQSGEDANALADRVIHRLNVLLEEGGAAFG